MQVWLDTEVEQRLPDVNPEDLRNAWLGLLARASVTRHHRVTREQLSVREHMSRILRSLQHSAFRASSKHLFETGVSAPVLVVTFLALLELARESLVKVTQQGAYSPIYVKLNHGLAAV